jgi:nucleolin
MRPQSGRPTRGAHAMGPMNGVKRPFKNDPKEHKKWGSEDEEMENQENVKTVQAKVIPSKPAATAQPPKVTLPPAKIPKRKPEVSSSEEEIESESESESESEASSASTVSSENESEASSSEESGSEADSDESFSSEEEEDSDASSDQDSDDDESETSSDKASDDEDSDASEEDVSEASEEEVSEASEEEPEFKQPEKKQMKSSSSSESKNVESNADATIFVGNLAWDATEQDVTDFFQGCGPIRQVRLLRDRNNGRSRGIAYVDFESASGVSAAFEKKGKDLLGRPVNIDRANSAAPHQSGKFNSSGDNSGASSRSSSPSHKSNPTPTLFVGNLSYNTTETTLSEVFSSFGPVLLTRIPTDQNRKSRGFGYVQFKSTEHAQAAMDAPRLEVDGRFVRLDFDSSSLDRKPKKF